MGNESNLVERKQRFYIIGTINNATMRSTDCSASKSGPNGIRGLNCIDYRQIKYDSGRMAMALR